MGSCCRCFDGFGEGEWVEGRDVEDYEEELGMNDVIWKVWKVVREMMDVDFDLIIVMRMKYV